jgi:hypothetical protein
MANDPHDFTLAPLRERAGVRAAQISKKWFIRRKRAPHTTDAPKGL